jgi:hypothetical protein
MEPLHCLLSEVIMTVAVRFVQAFFEDMHPCHCYMYDVPRIKKFLQESTLNQNTGIKLLVYYLGSS